MAKDMELTSRQKDILEQVIADYIKLASPVSSQMLEEDFDVSPATLRNEMLFLSDEGFLEKPHTSSGRIPTDKGYRFFVDEVAGKERKQEERVQEALGKEIHDALEFAAFGIRNLASLSSSLVAMYVEQKSLFWKEGWEDVLEEPEFEEQGRIKSFSRFLNDFENNVKELEPAQDVQVFIGKENPFSKVNDFSIMIAECDVPEYGRGLVALLGPKRMAYPRNIHVLNTFVDIWKKNQ